ncbi:MAG: hypothetical protein JWM88_2735 [Verrucomicrobia bacterium]|nr:hypothetical protein [Verrucomicrobiota bacterium]
MDSPAADSPRPPAPRFRLEAAGIALALLAYGLLLATHLAVFAGASDSSGYLNAARLIREGSLHVPQRAIEGLPPGSLPSFAYVTLGFTPVEHGLMVPTYPVGLPLLIAGVSGVVGWEHGASVTVWLHAMAGVVLLFAFARLLGFSRLTATLGALLLGGCPLYFFIGLQALSDTPALVWTMAAIYCAWRSRRHAGWALAAGGAVAVAVLVRPTNVLVLLPLAIALGGAVRRWLALVVGGLPGAVFLGVHHQRLYGKMLTTGYGDVSESFDRSFVGSALAHYAHWLPILLTPAVVLVLALPFLRRRIEPRLIVLLGAWILVFAGFYAFYLVTGETWWALRFILPVFPACILAMLVAGRALTRSWALRITRRIAWAAIAGTVAWDSWWCVQQQALGAREGEEAFVQAAAWARRRLPARAVVVCMQASGAFLYHTDFILLRYDFAGDVQRIDEACAAAARPIYAALYAFERTAALEQCLPGQWTQVGATRNVTFWRRDGPRPTPIVEKPWREFLTTRTDDTEVSLQVGAGWYDAEKNHRLRWSWCDGRGLVRIETSPPRNGVAEIRFLARGFESRNLTVAQEGRTLLQTALGTTRKSVSVHAMLRDGAAELEFSTDSPPGSEDPGPAARRLAFAIYNPEIALSSRPP